MKEDMKSIYCLACKGRLNEKPLLTLDGMPASAQDIPDSAQVNQDQGITLNLHQCPCCGLVQFDCQPVGYYRDVIRSGGFTTTMAELRRRQYRHFIKAYGLEGKKIIEAGCGRGEFLSILKEFPVQALGIEHREDLVQIAKDAGLTVWRQFTETENTILKSPDGKAGPPYHGFLSFNFLEHQPEPDKMLRCIWNNLEEDGVGLVTVPSLEYILEHNGYYELIRDHLAYYTFETLRSLMEHNGFRVVEEEMVNRDTLSVIVRKKAMTDKTAWERSAGIDIAGLVSSRQSINRQVNQLVNGLYEKGKTLAVWGASHQGFTLAATTGLGKGARYIMDSAPFKQGRFAPASHILIVAPDHFLEEPVDAILIVAPGYTDEIAGIIREKYEKGPGGEKTRIFTLRSSDIEEIT
jgi:SAM-dependent methyltransferase